MHPSVRIIALLMFAITAYAVHGVGLAFALIAMLVCLIIVGLLMPYGAKLNENLVSDDGDQNRRFFGIIEFLKLLRRVRYILLFLLIVYAFNTPGEYLPVWYFAMTPTYEGIALGIEQALRLSLVLAGLAILLVTTTRDQLIAGLYYLALPMRFLGLDPERFAVRLWLTLYYVEHGTKTQPKNALHQLLNLNELIDIDDSAPEKIMLMKPELTWLDALTVVILALMGAYFICA